MRVHEGVRTSCPVCQKRVSNIEKHKMIHRTQMLMLPATEDQQSRISYSQEKIISMPGLLKS